MGEVTRYPEGTFCWIDLGTPDVPGAKAFYGDLLGWEYEDLPSEQGGSTVMCRLRGRAVAAMHEQGGGAEWTSFISVEDADRATGRAEELGANVLEPPFDVMDAGRTSLLQDPVGAFVALWEPREQVGAGWVNEAGAWIWNELVTPDVDDAVRFYGSLFGWTVLEQPGAIRRAAFGMDEFLIGGVHEPVPGEGDASRWTVSFNVPDADRAVARAESLGGSVVIPPAEFPVGRYAIVADPAGAAFTAAAVPGGAFGGLDGSPPPAG